MNQISQEQVIELVKTLPPERLASLYDYALFLQSRTPESPEFEDLFGESIDQILADEARWEDLFERSRDQIHRMAREADAEYRAGKTTPMEFDEDGHLRR